MSGDIAQVASEMVPYITTALSAYGGAVLSKAEDNAADATVSAGRRLLLRVFGRKDDRSLPPAVAKVIANPGDGDYLAALRVAIRDVLENNAQVLAEVREILAEAGPTVNNFTGPRITAGRDAFYAERDITINRTAD